MRYCNAEHPLNLRLVEYGVVWARSLSWKLLAMTRLDFTLYIATLTGNLYRKVIPRTYALVGVVVDADFV